MKWEEAVIGRRVVVRVPTGASAGATVELEGELLGRGRFDSTPPYLQTEGSEFAARVRLDDGSIISAPVSSLVRRAE
jgi:hypothetical protein